MTITIPMLVAAAVGTLMGVWLTIVFLTSLADVSDFMGMYHSTDAVSGTVVFAVLGILSCWCALDIAAPAGNYLSGKKPDAKKQMNRSLSACVVFFALCVFVCWSSPYIGVFSNDFVVIGITFYFNRFTDVMTSGLIFSLIAMVALIAGRVLLAQGSQK